MQTKRVDSSSQAFASAVVTRDEETGNALRIEYDADGCLLRHAIATRFPPERWQDDVVGETVWYDENDRELRRVPILLGRDPFAA